MPDGPGPEPASRRRLGEPGREAGEGVPASARRVRGRSVPAGTGIRSGAFRRLRPARPSRRVLRSGSALVGLLLLPTTIPAAPPTTAPSAPAQPAVRFVEVTEDSGVSFRHDPGDLTGFPLPAITGAGAAFFDSDGDGDLDLYLIQSGPLPEHRDEAAPLPRNRLFRRQPDGRFRDETAASGLGDTAYGVGIAVGDVDGDGDRDLFLANYGADRLYRNEGDGRFTPAADTFPDPEPPSSPPGSPGGRWSTAAAFCDVDGDADLDLYVGGYLVNDPLRACVSASGEPDFCSPQSFAYERDTLWRNDGGGRFRDDSEAAGLLAVRRPALGVLCHDFTGDGRPDFYVANDGEPNLLWEQQPDGTFRDAALFLGAALNGQGRAEASMGVALGDADGDADLDLFLTHLRAQSNTLYRNRGGAFHDDTPGAGLGVPSLRWTGFGVRFGDWEHDGDLDLVLVNGAVARAGGVAPTGGLSEYAEPAQVFLGDGAGVFTETDAGDFSALRTVGRGLLAGDWDRDGDLDLVVTSVGGPARLFENRSPKAGGFLVVRPEEHSRAAPGAVVTVTLADGRALVRPVQPEAGFLTASEPVAHFGLVEGAEVVGLTVRWPDGAEERFPAPDRDSRLVAVRGRGRVIEPPAGDSPGAAGPAR